MNVTEYYSIKQEGVDTIILIRELPDDLKWQWLAAIFNFLFNSVAFGLCIKIWIINPTFVPLEPPKTVEHFSPDY